MMLSVVMCCVVDCVFSVAGADYDADVGCCVGDSYVVDGVSIVDV